MTRKVESSTSWYQITDTTGVYAPLVDGWALADTTLGVPSDLGVTPDGYQWSAEERSGADTTTDSLSNVNVVTYYAAAGTPPSHIQHFVNGELVNDQTILWVEEDDGWVMSETVWEFFQDGDTLIVWSSASGDIAAAGMPGLDLLRHSVLSTLQFFGPRPLEGQIIECQDEWADWMIAAAGVVAAYVVNRRFNNVLTRAAVTFAVARAAPALRNLTNCLIDVSTE